MARDPAARADPVHAAARWRAPRHRAAAGRVVVAIAIVTASAAGAEPRCYAVDAARSQVEFRIRVFGLFSPGGRFDRIDGTVLFDRQHWETLVVVVRIAVD